VSWGLKEKKPKILRRGKAGKGFEDMAIPRGCVSFFFGGCEEPGVENWKRGVGRSGKKSVHQMELGQKRNEKKSCLRTKTLREKSAEKGFPLVLRGSIRPGKAEEGEAAAMAPQPEKTRPERKRNLSLCIFGGDCRQGRSDAQQRNCRGGEKSRTVWGAPYERKLETVV